MTGKTTKLKTERNIVGAIKHVHVHGKESKTASENVRDALILSVLRGERRLVDVTLIRRIWFPTDNIFPGPPITGSGSSDRPRLNVSQANVVNAMLEGNEPIILVHGKNLKEIYWFDLLNSH